jgi:hypothetical protein
MPRAWRAVRRAVLLLVLLGMATIALAGVGCADRLIMPPAPAVAAATARRA